MSSSIPPVLPSTRPPFSPGKRPNLLLWIIGGVVALMCLVTLVCGVGGYMLVRKAKNAGLDTSLLSKNPAYAAAKTAATMNPDVETLSTDDRAGVIKVIDKKSGKISTLKFDPDKETMVITDESGKEAKVSITGEGNGAGVEVQSADGTAKFGGGNGNRMPAWMPVYPGSSPQGTFSSENGHGSQLGFSFKTKDAPAKVSGYFQDKLKSAGFTVNMATNSDQAGMVMAEDSAKNRSVMVTISTSGDGTEANILLTEKK